MSTPFVRFSPRERTWLVAALERLRRLPAFERIARLDRENLWTSFPLDALAQRLADAQLGHSILPLSADDCAALRAALRAVRVNGPDDTFQRQVDGELPLESSHVSSLLIRLGD